LQLTPKLVPKLTPKLTANLIAKLAQTLAQNPTVTLMLNAQQHARKLRGLIT
jgi:hypothetical protein